MKNKEYGIAGNINYIITALVIAVIITLLVMYSPQVYKFDNEILHSVRNFLLQYPSCIPVFVCSFGDISHYLLWPQITACCVLVSHKKYVPAILLVIAVRSSYWLTHFTKHIVCRNRPLTSTIGGYSHPSGHALITMCFYGILIYLIHRYVSDRIWRNTLICILGIWIFLVGISRLWLGVHFPLDVIAGMLYGFIIVNLYIIIIKLLQR